MSVLEDLAIAWRNVTTWWVPATWWRIDKERQHRREFPK